MKAFVVLFLAVAIIACGSLPAKKKTVTVWLQANDWEAGLASISNNRDYITEISPAWFWALPDSSIMPIPAAPVDDQKLSDLLRDYPIRLKPIISNVTPQGAQPDWLRELLGNPQMRNRMAANIANLVLTKNYDGIDLDFEGLAPNELPGLVDLVEELSRRLHEQNKTLAVTLQTTLAEGALASWQRIGDSADTVQIMLYSEHHERTGPGALASLTWIEPRLEQVLRVIPADKLQAGALVVAYSWSSSGVRSGTWQGLVASHLQKGIEVNRNPDDWSPWLQLNDIQIWYEDQLSMRRKLELYRDNRLQGVAIWRAGGEDPAIWSEIRSFYEGSL
jgi:spore germination protein